MKESTVSIIILFLLLISVAPIGNASGENSTKDPPTDIDVAFLLDTSSPAISMYAPGFLAAASIAIDHLNDKQDDYNFGFSTYDTGCSQSTAASSAEDIIDDGLFLVVGALCSGASLGSNAVLSAAGIPQISPTSTSPVLSDEASYPDFFRVMPSDALQSEALNAVVTANMPADETVAILHMDDNYGQGVADNFANIYEESNNTLCAQLEYYQGDTDFSSYIQEIIDAGCTSIVLVSYAADGAMIIEQAADVGFSGEIYGADGICSVSMGDEISDESDLDGVICTRPLTTPHTSSRAIEFNTDCSNNSDCAAGIFTAETYDAFSIMMESFILTEVENINLSDAIHYIGYEWEGASSNITFNIDGDVTGRGIEICEFDYSNSSLTLNCPEIYVPDSFNFIPDNELYGYDVFSLQDTDGDGIYDIFDDFPNDNCADTDTDQDGYPDTLLSNCTTTLEEDIDDDNDGVYDIEDAFPLDSTESLDTDGDGIGDLTDNDDDGDGFTDDIDAFPEDATEYADFDNDGIGDNADTDDDGDGFTDDVDVFPLDSTESLDTDGDTIGNNADTDDDGDGFPDIDDSCPMSPNNETVENLGVYSLMTEYGIGLTTLLTILDQGDTDNDGCFNLEDTDDDGDGFTDDVDVFPLDSTESLDTDGDTIGNNADTDDDGDGVIDSEDAFPLDSNESLDTDSDTIGNNADTDDDGDGFTDDVDVFPLDSTESLDTDGDTIGNNADTDDDSDGVIDSEDAFPLDSTESLDTDGDNIGNNADTDDDGDGVIDSEDAFPLDSTESLDTDGDTIGNNADTDDDNDLISDEAEITLGTDPLNSDTDGDGFLDSADDYPLDEGKYSASVEAENAGLPGFGASLMMVSLLFGAILFRPRK